MPTRDETPIVYFRMSNPIDVDVDIARLIEEMNNTGGEVDLSGNITSLASEIST